MKKQLIAIISMIIAIAIVIVLFHTFKSKSKYITKELKTCTITQTVEASGTINPVNTVSVGSTVSGLIKAIFVDFNDEVEKGEVLAQIDPATFEATVQQQFANINNARGNLAKLEAIANMDKKTYLRYKNLYAKNFIAKSELDQAESTYYSSIAQINSAKAQIAQAQAQYKTATTNLGYTKIIAPVDGTIVSRKIDVGQPVAASFQAPELFTIAQDLKQMQIEVTVSEADIGKIREGQQVIYTLDGYPDSEFEGTVKQVRIVPTTVSNIVTYPVVVQIQNEDLKLKPGMTANVSIIVVKKENVLCSPNLALKFTPAPNVKYENQGLWILKGSKPKRIDIKTGAIDDMNTEIISDKLKKGDLIILELASKKKKNSGKQPPKMRRMF